MTRKSTKLGYLQKGGRGSWEPIRKGRDEKETPVKNFDGRPGSNPVGNHIGYLERTKKNLSLGASWEGERETGLQGAKGRIYEQGLWSVNTGERQKNKLDREKNGRG